MRHIGKHERRPAGRRIPGRRVGLWFLSIVSRALVIVLVILFLLYGRPLYRLLSGVTGQIRTQSAILEQKLESSQRLEVTSVDEEGTMTADTSVIILGTVGSTTIRYRYTASIGIDLSKVIMTADTDRIIFALPEPEVLNDGIEALEINRRNFFSKAIDKSVEALLNEQRLNCRDQYLKEKQPSDRIWEDAVKAFNETICKWLDPYGERQYEFEFVRQDDPAAEETAAFFIRRFLSAKKQTGSVRLD